jgi:hypothetical protein
MSEYTGSFITYLSNSDLKHRMYNAERRQIHSVISTDKPRAGLYSLKIERGGVHEIFYGCDVGSTTITVYTYSPIVGGAYIEVLLGSVSLGKSLNTAANVWQQISVTFTAEKRVYKVRLGNLVSSKSSADSRVYFDDLE